MEDDRARGALSELGLGAGPSHLAALYGLTVFVSPNITLDVFVDLFGLYAVSDGIMAVAIAIWSAGNHGKEHHVTSRHLFPRGTQACASVAAIVLFSAIGSSQTTGGPEKFTAVAVNMGTPGRASADRVEIVVNRWSPAAARDRLLTALFEKGPDKLLDTLTDMPRAGYIRTPNSIGYDLHFAQRAPLPDGGERIVLVTDRHITFWEAANRPRSIDYPFTVIELHLNGDGVGEGKMSLATKITGDKEQKLIVLENYASQPVMLNNVRREKS
jgi:hypothetical protein